MGFCFAAPTEHEPYEVGPAAFDLWMSMQPVYEALFGFHVFGLGFVTSMAFIFCTGKHCGSCMLCNILCLHHMAQTVTQLLTSLSIAYFATFVYQGSNCQVFPVCRILRHRLMCPFFQVFLFHLGWAACCCKLGSGS